MCVHSSLSQRPPTQFLHLAPSDGLQVARHQAGGDVGQGLRRGGAMEVEVLQGGAINTSSSGTGNSCGAPGTDRWPPEQL